METCGTRCVRRTIWVLGCDLEAILFNMKLKEEVTNKLGEQLADDNPFITSDHFLMLMKSMAALAKVVLMASSGPAEAINGIQSLMVTFLKNIPDKAWEYLKKGTEQHGGPGHDTFMLLDTLRNYGGGKDQRYVEIVEEGEEETPPINAPIPKHPC